MFCVCHLPKSPQRGFYLGCMRYTWYTFPLMFTVKSNLWVKIRHWPMETFGNISPGHHDLPFCVNDASNGVCSFDLVSQSYCIFLLVLMLLCNEVGLTVRDSQCTLLHFDGQECSIMVRIISISYINTSAVVQFVVINVIYESASFCSWFCNKLMESILTHHLENW